MNCSWWRLVCFKFSPNKVTALPSCCIWRRKGPAGSKQFCSVYNRSSSKAAQARKWTFQHVWIILLPPNWTELCCAQIWSKRLKPAILSWGCLGKGGTSEESAKGAKEKQVFCQEASVCYHQVLISVADIFVNPQVDKVEKRLAQNIFCRRLNSALRADVAYVQPAELRVSCGRGSVQLRNRFWRKSPLCPHSVDSAVPTGLLCRKANGRGTPECTKGAPTASRAAQST